MRDPRLVALHVSKAPHLLDHLAPLCLALDMPLYILEKQNLELMRSYYPQVKIVYLSSVHEMNPFQLAEDFEIFFQSIFWSYDPIKLLGESIGKKIMLGYCPHGQSDKGFRSHFFEGLAEQDLMMVYGERMLDQFKQMGLFDRVPPFVRTGNYRLDYYQKFQAFYDQVVQKEVLDQFARKQLTVLYAPTWQDGESSSSFFLMVRKMIAELPDSINLIVKLHPNLEWKNPAEYYSLSDVFKKKRKNLVVLSDFPLIYPLLAKTDIYIGDFSSIGYDFLTFQKPMFFFDVIGKKSVKDPSHFLQTLCGESIFIEDQSSLFSLLEKNDNSKYLLNQKMIYDHTFEKNTTSDHMKKALFDIYGSSNEKI